MPFHAFFTLSSPGFSVRAYIHTAGLSIYGENPVEAAREYLEHAVAHRARKGRLEHSAYGIGILWGDERKNEKNIDLFGYQLGASVLESELWKSNPEVQSWTTRNGIYFPSTEITSEEGLILLGKEGELRRMTSSLEDYMSRSAAIPIFKTNIVQEAIIDVQRKRTTKLLTHR